MNFGFTEEQEILRSEARKFLADECPMTVAREIMESPDGHSPALWKRFAELGWLGLIVPEAYGGVGLSWVDWIVLLEETGRALVPSPLISAGMSALAIVEHGSEAQKRSWLPAIAEGSSIFTPALLERGDQLDPEGIELRADSEGDELVLSGHKLFVTEACVATHFVVACRREGGELALVVVEAGAPGVDAVDLPTIDPSKRLGRLDLSEVRVKEDAILVAGGAGPAIARLYDQAAAAVTAEAIGAAEAAHALMVEYAKNREQFGSLIGRFQGVKHPLAEMYVDIESFKSLLYYAAWCLDEAPEEAPRYVSMAKAYASDTLTRIGIDAIELHGAIGYTWEYDAQLYLKRSKWIKSMFGSADYHYDRVATISTTA